MNSENILSRPKKFSSRFFVSLFTVGSGIILGFLSFTGMIGFLNYVGIVSALPVLILSAIAFALSVLYEIVVYLLNIKEAFKKLFQRHYHERSLAKEYLSEQLKTLENEFPEGLAEAECPQFFKDYANTLNKLSKYQKKLNKKNKEEKKRLERCLKDMEYWFALQLFKNKNKKSPYASEVQNWLKDHEQEDWQKRLKDRRVKFKIILSFSVLAGLFMGISSTYLIVEAFSALPFLLTIPFALWPAIILPMALIAGIAYSLLTLNAVTDMVYNNTLVKWFRKLREDLRQGANLRNILMVSASILLGLIAIGLTICTAGTWWTIATKARPLFAWMKKIPAFVMGIINPIITGLSSLFFIAENTAESLEVIDKALNTKSPFKVLGQTIKENFKKLGATENWLQLLNPFRLLLKLTITPLRIILFLGHLMSIAATTDRMPGVPLVLAFTGALLSEGIEDFHYLDDEDIPSRILRFLFSPIYFLAALWDWATSRINRESNKKVLSFQQAWNKQRGFKEPEELEEAVPEQEEPSNQWRTVHTVFLLKKQINQLDNSYCNKKLAQQKIEELRSLKKEVKQLDCEDQEGLHQLLRGANRPIYHQNRLFAWSQKTHTQRKVEELEGRVFPDTIPLSP